MKIKILSIAEDDLAEGYRFYESQADGLGTYFQPLFFHSEFLILYSLFVSSVLLSKRFPFAVYYRVTEDTALVFAVLDCRRNPSWIRAKLPK